MYILTLFIKISKTISQKNIKIKLPAEDFDADNEL